MITTSPQFEVCIPLTLIQECPYPDDWNNPRNISNDPDDPGGTTKCGIIDSEYRTWRKQHGMVSQSVRWMTKDEAWQIYFNNYWLPHCPTLPVGLDLSFFDANVNSGVHSIELLQRALNLNPDRIWGQRTMTAVQALVAKPEIVVAIKNYTAARDHIYRTFRLFPNFGRDWERRTHEIGQQSLDMANQIGVVA